MDIKELRNEIDKINSEMVSLLVRRMEVSEEVAKYKKENGLGITDEKREKEILETVKKLAGKENEKEVTELFVLLMTQSRKRQEKVIKEND